MRIRCPVLPAFLLLGVVSVAAGEVTTPWPSPVYMDTAADPNIIRIADDGEGGAIVAWNELRESLHYIQFMRVDDAGAVVWGPVDLAVQSYDAAIEMQLVCEGGYFHLAWTAHTEAFDGYRVYAQRYRVFSGNEVWTAHPGGYVVAEATTRAAIHLDAASDGEGNLLIAYSAYPVAGGSLYAYAAHLRGVATTPSLPWGTEGAVRVSSSAHIGCAEGLPHIVPDGASGALVTWIGVCIVGESYAYSVYGQALSSGGSLLWGDDGVSLDETPVGDPIGNPALAGSGDGGAIATWHHHNMGTGATMLYVRRLAPGDPLSGWGPLSFPEFQLDEDIDSPDPFLFEEFPAAPEVTLLVGTDPDGKGTQLAGAELSASTGATHWSNTSICELGGYTPRLRAVSDNQGGAIVARVLVSDRTELWALQVDGETGEVDGSATLVAAPTGMQYLIDLCTTGGGGAYVAGGTGDRVFVVRLGLNHAGSAYLVKPDGTGIFPTIQDAINAAAHGDTVLLANGVFTGEGNRDIDFMGKAIVVRSQFGAADSCVIDCEDHGSAVFFQSGEDRASILEGVRLYDARYSAIKCSQTSPTIRDCEFVSNRGTCGGGINCWEASPMISRCLFQANWADNTGGAICWDGGGSLTLDSCTIVANYAASLGGGVFGYGGNAQISHCTILDNLGSTGGGIWLSGDASTEVRNTIVAFSIDGGAIRCGTHSVPLLDCCDIYGNYGGDWVGPIADQLGINGNFTADPYFCDAESGDYHLWNYSPCNQVGCGLIGAWPVGCSDPQAVGPEPRTQALWASVWPNPVSGTAQIRYVLPTATPATLTIYDPAGRVVRSLASHGEAIGTLTWDATDVVGRHVPAGAYFLRLQNGEQETLRRLIVVR